ncbi:MAG: DUF3486 family protein, partial [Holophagales bacterium]|nr:DUF3486 family protein [Holophagales bacterium]MYI81326.1 DUF3486 family protein [Holophagales bacterium]
LLRSGVPQTEIIERLRAPLADAGEAPLSKAGLNRYSTRMEAVGAKIKETRAIADAWIARLGDEPTGDVGQLTIEILRTLAFDAAAIPRVDEDGEPIPLDPEMIGDLALAISRLERAAAIGQTREAKMREAMAKEAAAEARRAGVTKATTERIRAVLLGRPT